MAKLAIFVGGPFHGNEKSVEDLHDRLYFPCVLPVYFTGKPSKTQEQYRIHTYTKMRVLKYGAEDQGAIYEHESLKKDNPHRRLGELEDKLLKLNKEVRATPTTEQEQEMIEIENEREQLYVEFGV